MGRFEQAINVLTFIVALVPLYFQFFQPAGTTESLLIFGIIMGVVIISYTLDFFITRIQDKIARIDENRKRIKNVREHVDYMEEVHKLDKRVSLIEDKVGSVDPRIVALVILILLVILYLRSIGVL